MDVQLSKSFFCGNINAQPSKSYAHRAIIAAALFFKQATVKNVQLSQDIKATINAVHALGCTTTYDGKNLNIVAGKTPTKCSIDCLGSATTLRLLMPICAALGIETTFVGDKTLVNRTFAPLKQELEKHGIVFSKGNLPTTISGKLQCGEYNISGDISSQFLSGLLFALQLVKGNSVVNLTTKLQSKDYVLVTLDCLNNCGIKIDISNGSYYIKGHSKSKFANFEVENDYSNAAFWLVAGALNGEVTVSGLKEKSLQGDKKILHLLKKAGVDIKKTPGGIKTSYCQEIKPLQVDVKNIPDLVPALCMLLCVANGESILKNAGRLRLKESDRLQAVAECLNKFGAKAEICGDSLKIIGTKDPSNCTVNSFDDHRIVMAAAVMAARCKEIKICGAEVVNKSYPAFFQDFAALGGKINVVNMGQ